MTRPGIPNEFALSTSCFGTRLNSIDDQIFAAVAMGFRRIELGLTEAPPSMEGLEDSQRETGMKITSMVAGCRDSTNGTNPIRLGSQSVEERERSMNSVRRHVRLARQWGCDLIVVRGSQLENRDMQRQKHELESELVRRGMSGELKERIAAFVARVQRNGHKQVEHLCRSLHTMMQEAPDMRFAIEPGMHMDDLLGFDAMGWVLDDLAGHGLKYWHDVGRIHLREKLGLPEQGRWLEVFGPHMVGVHMQDAAEAEAEMPLGLGEVDFKLIAEYLPHDALRVLELNPRHGRAEVLSSVQYLMEHGF